MVGVRVVSAPLADVHAALSAVSATPEHFAVPLHGGEADVATSDAVHPALVILPHVVLVQLALHDSGLHVETEAFRAAEPFRLFGNYSMNIKKLFLLSL